MTEVRTVHTADLTDGERTAIRELLTGAFPGGFEDTDWEHTLGGIHATVWEGGEPTAHGAVVQRRLLHAGRALRAGYVEGVAVREDRRGQGHGAVVMAKLEDVVRRAYDLGALSSAGGVAGFYAARGWKRWEGRSCVLAPSGIERTPDDDGSLHVLEAGASLDVSGVLVCDWRDGDVW